MEISLASLFKKKVSEEKVAELFVNIIFNSVDTSFPEVAELINNDLQFAVAPTISAEDQDAFLMIVIAGNYDQLDRYFTDGQEERIRQMVAEKLAKYYEVDSVRMRETINEMVAFVRKANFPSKNMLYGMSKAVFYKYRLNPFQKDYFRNLGSPDPIFLKHLDEIMEQFMINWEHFTEKYKVA